MVQKVNKYRAIRTNGFASKKEATRFQELKLLEKSGEIRGLECQVRFPLKVNNQLVCTFVADFCYRLKNAAMVTEDVKGVRTPVYKLKAKLMKAIYGITILET
jgi:hypothetical protein